MSTRTIPWHREAIDAVKKPATKARKSRCHVCGDECVEAPAGSGFFRHKKNSDCPFQPGEDLDPAVCCRVLAAFGYPVADCSQLLARGGKNALAGPVASHLQKLSDLILDTPHGMILDWHGDPVDGFLVPLARIAVGNGVQIEWEYDETDLNAVRLGVRSAGRWRRVLGKIGPAEVVLTSLYELAKRVEKASGGRLVTRVIRIYQPSDTWGYVTLAPEGWQTVEEAAGEAFAKIFMP
jgi:hypothetical protein